MALYLGAHCHNWPLDALGQLRADYYLPFSTGLSWATLSLSQWDALTLSQWDALPLDSASLVAGSAYFTYDEAGNRLTHVDAVTSDVTTYTYDDANQLLTAEDLSGITTYTYDANGNRLTIEEPLGDITTNTWNCENRLVQVEHDGGETIEYAYNGDGLLVEKTIDGTDTTRYVYDGNNVLQETDGAGTKEAEMTYVPDTYGEAISQRRGSDSSFYHFDGTKNVRQLTDGTESITDEYQHDAWGEPMSSTGTTANSQRYKGQLMAYREDPDAAPEAQLALHHRHYDPQTGTFSSRDPAEDDPNLYRYVKNNPVNREDPSGLEVRGKQNALSLSPQTAAFISQYGALAREFTEKNGIPAMRNLDLVLASGWKVALDDVWAWNNAYQDATTQTIWIEEDLTIQEQAVQLNRIVKEIVANGLQTVANDGILRPGDIETWNGEGNQHQALIRGRAQAAKLIKDTSIDVASEFLTAGGGLFFTHSDDVFKVLRAADKGTEAGSNAQKAIRAVDKAPSWGVRGFSSAEQFSQAGTELAEALQKSGLKVQQTGVRGSAVTGVSSKGGGFRVGAENGLKPSDIDVFVEFAEDIGINSSRKTPGFIHPDKLLKNYPALREWSAKWSRILGREITPGGFKPGTFNDPDVIGF